MINYSALHLVHEGKCKFRDRSAVVSSGSEKRARASTSSRVVNKSPELIFFEQWTGLLWLPEEGRHPRVFYIGQSHPTGRNPVSPYKSKANGIHGPVGCPPKSRHFWKEDLPFTPVGFPTDYYFNRPYFHTWLLRSLTPLDFNIVSQSNEKSLETQTLPEKIRMKRILDAYVDL